MADKQKALTAHGEVEYETVECSSCGEYVVKEDAMRFGIADSVDHNYRADEKRLTGVQKVGWVCPLCRNDPIKYPRPTNYETSVMYLALACCVCVAFLMGVTLPL